MRAHCEHQRDREADRSPRNRQAAAEALHFSAPAWVPSALSCAFSLCGRTLTASMANMPNKVRTENLHRHQQQRSADGRKRDFHLAVLGHEGCRAQRRAMAGDRRVARRADERGAGIAREGGIAHARIAQHHVETRHAVEDGELAVAALGIERLVRARRRHDQRADRVQHIDLVGLGHRHPIVEDIDRGFHFERGDRPSLECHAHGARGTPIRGGDGVGERRRPRADDRAGGHRRAARSGEQAGDAREPHGEARMVVRGGAREQKRRIAHRKPGERDGVGGTEAVRPRFGPRRGEYRSRRNEGDETTTHAKSVGKS